MASRMQSVKSMRLGFASSTLAAALALSSTAAAQDILPAAAPPPTAAESPTEANSPALLVTGTVLGVLGVGAIGTGAAFWAGDPCSQDTPEGQCGMGFGRLAGMFLMGGGGLLVLTGTPMIVAGAWQVPSEDRGVPPTTAELRVGAGRAELGVTF